MTEYTLVDPGGRKRGTYATYEDAWVALHQYAVTVVEAYQAGWTLLEINPSKEEHTNITT